jgi:integral membrane sensor domain MASE1
MPADLVVVVPPRALLRDGDRILAGAVIGAFLAADVAVWCLAAFRFATTFFEGYG